MTEPKPDIEWAVYSKQGNRVTPVVPTRSMAVDDAEWAIECDYVPWKTLQLNGYTVRRVTLTPDLKEDEK